MAEKSKYGLSIGKNMKAERPNGPLKGLTSQS